MFAAHDASTVQVPVPLFIVTRSPLTVQTPVVFDVILGVTPEFCVVATLKVDKYTELVGAPVKVTVGAILITVLTAVTVSMTGGAGV